MHYWAVQTVNEKIKARFDILLQSADTAGFFNIMP